jgi:hypothetical protein
MIPTTLINAFFDRHVRPDITLFGRSRPRFLVLGWTGFGAALLLSQGLAAARGLSGWVMLLVSLCGAATFLGQAMLVKMWTGNERLVYYHHQVAILATSAGLLWLLRHPLLTYLDLTMLGVGTMLAFGRVGCLMAGCCHGRPHDWGVHYRQAHVDTGFPPHLADTRLLPIQAFEAGWVGLAVLAGSLRLLAGARPGEVLAAYLLAYAAGRFLFEFLRGDPERSYALGYSEAQWTSLVITAAILAGELLGWLPAQPIHLAAGGVLLLSFAGIALHRRHPDPRRRLFQARHMNEIARGLAHLSPGEKVQVVTTSLGLNISFSVVQSPGKSRMHYAFSSRLTALTPAAATALARLVRCLKHPQSPGELINVTPGVFHWVVDKEFTVSPEESGAGEPK